MWLKKLLSLSYYILISIATVMCKSQTKCHVIKVGEDNFVKVLPSNQVKIYRQYLSSFDCTNVISIEYLNRSKYSDLDFYGIIIKSDFSKEAFKNDFKTCDNYQIKKFPKDFKINEEKVGSSQIESLECMTIGKALIFRGFYENGEMDYTFVVTVD